LACYGDRMSFRPLAVVSAVILAAAFVRGQTIAPAALGPFPKFDRVTEKAGIDFQLDSGSPAREFIIESNSAGVVALDYDNDGWIDLYFVNGSTVERLESGQKSRGNRLYRNNHDGTFSDVTDRTGTRGNGDWAFGGCAGDVDNNGFDDLFVTTYGRDVLLLNNGNGTFRDVSRAWGIESPGRWHSGCAFGDYDRDGDLDLYVSNYAQFTVAASRAMPYYRDRDPKAPFTQPGPDKYPTTPHEFYENTGRGRFVDASVRTGITRATTKSKSVPGAYGFGVVWGDYDNDGDLDIYVASDTTANLLFRNNGDRTFTDVAASAGAAVDADGRSQAGMGVDMADYDNDGRLDLAVTNFAEDHFTIYHNEGNGTFADVSKRAGLMPAPYLGWGAQFVDLDHDGLLDLVTVNGHVNPSVQMGARAGRRAGYRQRPLIFHQVAGGLFREVGLAAGQAFGDVYSSRGLAVADLNNDGQMDLVFANQEEKPAVLLNRGVPGHWLTVKLKATQSNRSAIGARVTLKAGGLTQLREVKSGGSFLSQSDLRVHFGLGTSSSLEALTVRWPSGRTSVEHPTSVDQILTITEPAR